jgi:hypothetical protein
MYDEWTRIRVDSALRRVPVSNPAQVSSDIRSRAANG